MAIVNERFPACGNVVNLETLRRWMIQEGIWKANESGGAMRRRWRERAATPG